jgi:hypothetical protein
MKHFSLLVVLAVGSIWGLGHMANLDIPNGLKTAFLTLANKDLVKSGSRSGLENPVLLSRILWLGSVEEETLIETSGLAQSKIDNSLFYAINDSGNDPKLFGLDSSGKHLGTWNIDYRPKHDFEDLAAFEIEGDPYLLVADTGDNLNWRKSQSLLLLKEPSLEGIGKNLDVVKRVTFSFLNGHRDIESVAVDESGKAAYIVSKKRIPPEVFRVSLDHEGHQILEALGTINSIPAPTPLDLDRRGRFGIYSSLPTAMDFHSDKAVVLTYKELYLFEKKPDDDWVLAFSGVPKKIPLPQIYGLEAVAFAGPQKILLTGERENGRKASEIFEVSF